MNDFTVVSSNDSVDLIAYSILDIIIPISLSNINISKKSTASTKKNTPHK